ncbi:Isochorismatase-like protein [Clohesyomyces aquaticus]|uniref:Isochorismatase-like protein n=1 Tax=Clohesyomyces aquaticus TaxID=1231657 RepID=A0A1Y1ZYB0_9PLEO|nr:Isochorismatase-like protein [Clohesyomyces aquaticus]
MATNTTSPTHRKAIIGPPSNFWLHSTRTGFDLTHPSSPSTPSPSPNPTITLQTTTSPIKISPFKSALVIIDMQNFFLSSSFGRTRGPGHLACSNLINHAIPAARKAGIRIIWLNWGLSDSEVVNMPPAVKRAFGFEAVDENSELSTKISENAKGVDKFGDATFQGGHVLLENGKNGAIYRGLGSECGTVKFDDGTEVDAGRLLMRDTWNAALYSPLDAIYEEGKGLTTNPDVWIHKNRMSGLWGGTGACEEFLENEGIRTLLFAGVNTDQCVGGTFMDAFSKGYDCVLLSDGCGTTSPEFAQQCFEFNAAKTFGFCVGCGELERGVDGMES